jgi:hypothetical protein
VNTVYFDFHSSDSVYSDYSTRIQSIGGSTIGQGHMMIQGSTINILGTSGVGIGTSNPTALLQVGAPNDISYANFTSSGAGETIYSSYATVPSISGNTAFGGNLNVFSSAAYARNSGGSITLGGRMYNYSPSYYQFSPLARISGVQDNTVDNYIGNLVMETMNQGTMYERMRINQNGYVGIGTTNPTAKLHIYGGGQSTALSDVYSFNISSVDSFNGDGGRTVYSESINMKAGDLTWSNNSIRVYGSRIYIGGGYSINGAQNQGNIIMYTGNAERARISDNGIALPGTNYINFGWDQTKEPNAGKMGYQIFTSGALDIVGAGTGTRTVKVWDNLTVSGNIGIGTFSPNITLDAWGTNNGIGRNRFFGSQHDADKRDSFYIGRWDSTNANYFLGMKCMIDTPANIGYGVYNNQTMLSFITWGSNYTDPAESMRIRGDGIVMFNRYTSNGTLITSGSNGLITVSSDRRVKEHISYLDDTVVALDQINHLKPATFRFIGQPDTHLGFIAQDVEQYIPLAVDGKKHEYQWETDEKGNPKVDANGEIIYRLNDQGEKLIRPRGLTDRAIIAVQTLAIQELSKTATSQATLVQELSKKIDTLIARLNAAGIA